MNTNNKITDEFEARAALNEKQYLEIKNEYLLNYSFESFTNINKYYDRNDLFLTNHHMVLRKRIIGNDVEVTLKIKQENSDKEITNSNLNPSCDICSSLNDGIIKILQLNNIDISSLQLVGELITERIEISFPNYLFVLDKNFYNNKIDYNIEIEASSREEAQEYLDEILKKFGVQQDTKYISKSRRAILKL